MAEPKISTFLVAMILVSGTVTLLALSMSNLSSNYGAKYDDNESLAVLSKLDTLTNLTLSSKEEVLPDKSQQGGILSNTVDVLGDLFKNGYNAIKSISASFDVFQEMADTGLSKVTMGKASPVIRTVIISSVLIIIVVGVIISVLVKRQI